MIFKQFSTILFVLTFIISVNAQDHHTVAHFDGAQTGKVIQLTFVITAGNQCEGVRILRSTNEHNFIEIGQLTGVCGNNESDETFSFIDISPVKNADNFYQLDLKKLCTSDIIKVHFTDYREKGYVLNPNPVIEKSILYFQNDCNDEFDFVLLDKRGKKVKSMNKIRSNAIEISRGNLKSGTYTFQLILDNKVKYTGAILFQ